jgi:flavorubredoxin
MTDPVQIISRRARADTEVLTSSYFVPGYGLVPINAFLLRAEQPVLVDTGAPYLASAYLAALRSIVALDEIEWIWLTHTDADHVGTLWDVLEAAPRAKLVTTFLGLGKLGLVRQLPPERILLLNPGEVLSVGDRELVAFKPPSYDAPETTGFLDTKTHALFCSDCFGGLLPEVPDRAEQIPEKTLHDAMVLWATIDAPWLAAIHTSAFDAAIDRLRELAPSLVLSSHLPPAEGMLDALVDNLSASRTAPPFIGPNQAQLAKMLAESAAPPAIPG